MRERGREREYNVRKEGGGGKEMERVRERARERLFRDNCVSVLRFGSLYVCSVCFVCVYVYVYIGACIVQHQVFL